MNSGCARLRVAPATLKRAFSRSAGRSQGRLSRRALARVPLTASWRGGYQYYSRTLNLTISPADADCLSEEVPLFTTNAIESLNAQVRKAVRVRGHFPSEEAATKLIWLVLRNIQARWKNPPVTWQAAKAQMAIQFEDRFVLE